MSIARRSSRSTPRTRCCATKISFMNELANVAERAGADIEDVRMGIGSDPRIGYDFIYPGCGYGGSCFPKDVQALAASAGKMRLRQRAARAVETRQSSARSTVLFEKIRNHFNGELRGKVVALWGLAFKPNTERHARGVEPRADGVPCGTPAHASKPTTQSRGARRSKSTVSATTCFSVTAPTGTRRRRRACNRDRMARVSRSRLRSGEKNAA